MYKNNLLLKIAIKSAVVFICLFIVGCSPSQKTIKSPVDLPGNFSVNGSEVLPAKWWQSFNDEKLNEIIEQALGNNFSIRSTWDRLTQAEQIAVKTSADLFPDISHSSTAKRTREETDDVATYSTKYTMGLAISYEIDLWGRIRSLKQAALLDATAAMEDVYAAAITLSSNVAKTWYQLAEAKQNKQVLNRQLATNEKVLDIITTQFRTGQVGAADVYRQRQLVESTNGQLIQAEENIMLLQHRLSVLIGKSPAQWWADDEIGLIELPALPETGLPSVVIQNRPDVASAYKAIQAADMRVAAAVAEQYPTISISSTIETSTSVSKPNLFDDWLANLAGNALGPIFDAGYRKAEVKRKKAMLSESINNYGQAVLEAVRETEDAINQELLQRKYIDNLNKQLQLARRVYERTEQNYIKGQIDYVRVLDALISQQQLEISQLNARRILIERRIDICKAIAAGWEMEPPKQAEIIEK